MTITAQTAHEQIRSLVVDAVHESRDAGGTIYDAGKLAADRIVEGLDELFSGEDLSAPWIETVLRTRDVAQGPTVLALARMLERDESTPAPLRAIASAYLRSRVTDHPAARLTDPATSRDAAEKIRDVVRSPGGKLHRVLAAYGTHARQAEEGARMPLSFPELRRRTDERGLTAREVEDRFGIPAAHKRTSELLRDGLLEVVRVDSSADGEERAIVDLVRDGGRVLRITLFGRQELDRLNEIQPMIE